MVTRARAVAADGTPLHVEVAGGGEPLLLIAGLGLDHLAWDAVAGEYASRHTVITYDHRGTGMSGLSFPERWSTRDFAQDALAVLDAVDVERTHVFGHSMGGRVAQWLAIDAPERVGALVLGATTGGDARGVPRPAEVTAAMRAGDTAALLRFCFTDAYLATHPEALQLLAPRASVEAQQAHLQASTAHDAWESLASIRAPTLVLHGDEDGLTVAENGRRLAAAIPGAELMLLRGARHAFYADTPSANAAVLDFLARHAIGRR